MSIPFLAAQVTRAKAIAGTSPVVAERAGQRAASGAVALCQGGPRHGPYCAGQFPVAARAATWSGGKRNRCGALCGRSSFGGGKPTQVVNQTNTPTVAATYMSLGLDLKIRRRFFIFLRCTN